MSEHKVFEGRIVTVFTEDAVMPDGAPVAFEIVRHPGGAAVVALDGRGAVCLLRHYRHAVGEWLWEVPAGKLDGDAPLATARRELAEEAGVRAARWQGLGVVHSSPGVFTERVHLFLARDLDTVERAPEPGEVFEVHWIPLARAVDDALAGRISDAKSVIALVRAQAALRGEAAPAR